jgi:glycosyltransferase involved in cell wall biosynthesis
VLVEDVWGCRAETMTETGSSIRTEQRPRSRDAARPLRLIWSGQHIGRKMLPVLLQAIQSLRDSGDVDFTLAILGAGPETGRWQEIADQLELGDRVRWAGWLPYERALAEIDAADVLVFTGVQEGTPHVILEALSHALPVICHDACGMSAAVTGHSGIKVPLRDPSTSVHGFADAIRRLSNPFEYARLSAGALARASELTWQAKAQRIASAYASVLSKKAPAGHPVMTAVTRRQHRRISIV